MCTSHGSNTTIVFPCAVPSSKLLQMDGSWNLHRQRLWQQKRCVSTHVQSMQLFYCKVKLCEFNRLMVHLHPTGGHLGLLFGRLSLSVVVLTRTWFQPLCCRSYRMVTSCYNPNMCQESCKWNTLPPDAQLALIHWIVEGEVHCICRLIVTELLATALHQLCRTLVLRVAWATTACTVNSYNLIYAPMLLLLQRYCLMLSCWDTQTLNRPHFSKLNSQLDALCQSQKVSAQASWHLCMPLATF